MNNKEIKNLLEKLNKYENTLITSYDSGIGKGIFNKLTNLSDNDQYQRMFKAFAPQDVHNQEDASNLSVLELINDLHSELTREFSVNASNDKSSTQNKLHNFYKENIEQWCKTYGYDKASKLIKKVQNPNHIDKSEEFNDSIAANGNKFIHATTGDLDYYPVKSLNLANKYRLNYDQYLYTFLMGLCAFHAGYCDLGVDSNPYLDTLTNLMHSDTFKKLRATDNEHPDNLAREQALDAVVQKINDASWL